MPSAGILSQKILGELIGLNSFEIEPNTNASQNTETLMVDPWESVKKTEVVRPYAQAWMSAVDATKEVDVLFHQFMTDINHHLLARSQTIDVFYESYISLTKRFRIARQDHIYNAEAALRELFWNDKTLKNNLRVILDDHLAITKKKTRTLGLLASILSDNQSFCTKRISMERTTRADLVDWFVTHFDEGFASDPEKMKGNLKSACSYLLLLIEFTRDELDRMMGEGPLCVNKTLQLVLQSVKLGDPGYHSVLDLMYRGVPVAIHSLKTANKNSNMAVGRKPSASQGDVRWIEQTLQFIVDNDHRIVDDAAKSWIQHLFHGMKGFKDYESSFSKSFDDWAIEVFKLYPSLGKTIKSTMGADLVPTIETYFKL